MYFSKTISACKHLLKHFQHVCTAKRRLIDYTYCLFVLAIWMSFKNCQLGYWQPCKIRASPCSTIDCRTCVDRLM